MSGHPLFGKPSFVFAPQAGVQYNMDGHSVSNGANGTSNGVDEHEARQIDEELLQNSSLDALQDTEQREIMDIVDRLRRTGLSSVLQLPQLVVCGDQSSGKSSVLEAITEIPFPRKENLCTRFATEIVMRRSFTSSIVTKITPDKARPSAEQVKLKAFSRTIEDFSELPDLIDEATELMGLKIKGSNDDSEKQAFSVARAFSKDVLSIEITGPGRPQLTLVDLPGLIHSENKSQTKHDVDLIRDLVQDYISNERTIILAVISAKNDYANQIILDKARGVDPDGTRTLGIITKPDFLRPGSDNERDWIDLAQNKDIFFELGWHIVKNRADGELHLSFQERNEAEALFFSTGRYGELDRSILGVETLRTRLSLTLSEHLKRELPGLKKEMDTKLDEAIKQLGTLGESRATLLEQKQYLANLSLGCHELIKSAVSGHYEQSFFEGLDTDGNIESSTNIRRLRAVIQHLNLQFARQMRLRGRKYIIGNKKSPEEEDNDLDAYSASENEAHDVGPASRSYGWPPDIAKPKELTRAGAIDWVQQVLVRSRGRELPGNFNPMLISQLFWELSTPWERMAVAHMEKVAGICSEFVSLVLKEKTSRDVETRLQGALIEAALKRNLQNAHNELKSIIADKQRQPITLNHYYTTTIQKLRRKKHNKRFRSTINDNQMRIHNENDEERFVVDTEVLEQQLDKNIELDMDRFSAEEALDSTQAFYKQELKYFTDVVVKQVIERHLICTLPENIFSPAMVPTMSENDIKFIASEAPDVTAKRRYWEGRCKMLEEGQSTFRRAMGTFRT